VTKQTPKERNKDRLPHREQIDSDPKPGSVDYILSMVQVEAEKIDIAKHAFNQGLISFSQYHKLTNSITDNVAKITRLARDLAGEYSHLGDIHVELTTAPQIAQPHEDGSVDLEPLEEVTFNGKQFYQFTDDEGMIRLLPIYNHEGGDDETTDTGKD